MKIIALLLFALLSFNSWSQSTIDFHYKNGANDSVWVAYYFGTSQYVKDTFVLDAQGNAKWEADEKLPGGIYMIVLPEQSNQFVEFLWDGKPIEFTVMETEKLPEFMVSGNKNAEKFQAYAQRLQEYGAEKERIETGKGENMANQLNALNEEAYSYILEQIESNKNNLYGKFIKFNQDITIPEDVSKEGNARFYYYRDHFFDNTPFNDPWVIYTPGYTSKLETYLEKLTAKHQDSIIQSIDFILSQIDEGTENYKLTLITLFNKYAVSKAMYAGNIYTHMAEKYYLSGKAFWIDDEQLSEIEERYNNMKNNGLGDTAVNITVLDASGKKVKLLDETSSEYTLLFFWDIDRHRRSNRVMEELKAFARDKQDDLSILGVQTNITLLEALGADKINTKFETSWPNYHMVNEESKRDYDVFHGVTLYLLDRDKKILAKRFSLEQLDSILKNLREGR